MGYDWDIGINPWEGLSVARKGKGIWLLHLGVSFQYPAGTTFIVHVSRVKQSSMVIWDSTRKEHLECTEWWWCVRCTLTERRKCLCPEILSGCQSKNRWDRSSSQCKACDHSVWGRDLYVITLWCPSPILSVMKLALCRPWQASTSCPLVLWADLTWWRDDKAQVESFRRSDHVNR